MLLEDVITTPNDMNSLLTVQASDPKIMKVRVAKGDALDDITVVLPGFKLVD